MYGEIKKEKFPEMEDEMSATRFHIISPSMIRKERERENGGVAPRGK